MLLYLALNSQTCQKVGLILRFLQNSRYWFAWECVLKHMHHSWWSYSKTATPRRLENPKFLRETEPFDLYVWVTTTTLLCSIFLPVLVKAIPCIGKDLGMCTGAYASLMVELQQDGYTSKTQHLNGI